MSRQNSQNSVGVVRSISNQMGRENVTVLTNAFSASASLQCSETAEGSLTARIFPSRVYCINNTDH